MSLIITISCINNSSYIIAITDIHCHILVTNNNDCSRLFSLVQIMVYYIIIVLNALLLMLKIIKNKSAFNINNNY